MIEYIINKEKRTIVAMIKLTDKSGDIIPTFKNSDIIFDNLWEVLKRLKHNDGVFWDKKYFLKSSKMYFPERIYAKAKCNPDDEWDEQYGKQLARNRLVEKIRNYRYNSYKILIEMIISIYHEITN